MFMCFAGRAAWIYQELRFKLTIRADVDTFTFVFRGRAMGLGHRR
jgi:hypothetical protein